MSSSNYFYDGAWALKGQYAAPVDEPPRVVLEGPTAHINRHPVHRPDPTTRHTLAVILALTVIVLLLSAL